MHYSLVDFRILGPLEIWDDGRPLAIGSAKQRALLAILLVNANRVVPTGDLLLAVWGYDFDPESNILEVYINFLRKKLDRGHERKLLHTVRGVGYVLREEAE